MKKTLLLSLLFFWVIALQAQIVINDPDNWTTSQMSQYVGQTVTFASPMYVCNNYYYSRGQYTISAHRIYSPTNQELPATAAYETIVDLNRACQVKLTGIPSSQYHRMGERIENLRVKVTQAGSWEFVSGNFVGNTRAEMEAGFPSVDVRGEHTLLVCAMNLEYFLATNFGTGFGPDNAAQHEKQKTKILQALSHIQADIYGFVEVEQGQAALQELAQMMTEITGRRYAHIDDGGSPNGSYTKSGYIYCVDKVSPVGNMQSNNTKVSNRKKMQAFKENATGEKFIFSLNHFKAKSGSGTGADADQGDGQGIFNGTRKTEAQSVLTYCQNATSYYGDEDILIMGDLNAYAKEDPIMILINGGMTDLHRYFHGDISYSYQYHETAGYLDHALANSSMLAQITGMTPYHINSDEHDNFTYDKSNDATMFRCSDHDPVIVGLRLGSSFDAIEQPQSKITLAYTDGQVTITGAENGYYQVYSLAGCLMQNGSIDAYNSTISLSLPNGCYIVNVFTNGMREQFKVMF